MLQQTYIKLSTSTEVKGWKNQIIYPMVKQERKLKQTSENQLHSYQEHPTTTKQEED